MLSPGVYTQEVDASTIVPNVSNNIAFFAGDFSKGPAGIPYVITNKVELEKVFGTPTNENYNQWFQCYKFFDYADQLVVTRGYEIIETSFVDNTVSTGLARQKVFEFYDDGSGNTIKTKNKYNLEVNVGDFISIGNSNIIEVTDVTFSNGITEFGGTSITGNDGDPIYLYTYGHKNGGTQAAFLGSVTNNRPDTARAIDDTINIDKPFLATGEYHDNRLMYNYDLIKNDEDWDYNYIEKNFRDFVNDSKLKFFTKTPSSEKIEICIANSFDFMYETGVNKAVAFSEQIGDNYSNTYLTDIFSYFPQEGQIAIAIKQGDQLETFIVSFDETSVDGNNKSNYIENVINDQSSLVYVLENSSVLDLPATYLVCDRFGWNVDGNGDDVVGTPATNGTATQNLIVQGGRSHKISVGSLTEAYFTVEDKEKYEIDVVIGNEFSDGSNFNQQIAIDLAEKRKDCIAFIGARYEDTVGKSAGEATNAIVKYITNPDTGVVKLTRSMFASFYGNYFRIYDNFNKKYRWINSAGVLSGIRCDVSGSQNSWSASAGMKRGIIRNIDRMSFSPSLPQRDLMYKNGVNPLVAFPGTGNLVWGNKTLLGIASSFDRVNVRNLFNTLERAMAKAAKSQVFEFNDHYTRNSITAMFNPYLSTIKAGRGIVDFLVICDETNNTPDIISRNELHVDIFIKPNYVAEFIQLTFTNVGTRSFASVIGA